MTMTCTITGLFSYPVKSCRGSSMDAVTISPQGIEGDRQLLILKDGKFTNQARLPKLARIDTRRIDTNTIEFSQDGGTAVVHEATSEGTESVINFYGNQVAVIDQGDAIAAYVSAVIGTEVRIAGLKETFKRSVPLEEFAVVDGIDQSRFVDVAPILVTNEASLADLNARLDTGVPMARFRPNIVIEGLDAFAEDEVSALHGNGWRLLRATHCERCAVTCTDQRTGERSNEPLAALKSYRQRADGYAGGVMFGAYMGVEMEVLDNATIQIGDKLTIS